MGGLEHFIIEKSGVGKKFIKLVLHFRNKVWMTMSDMGNIIDAVQDSVSILFVEVLSSCKFNSDGFRAIGD
jgi:hypothetical protein